jgi:hypothetical protein
MGYLALGKATAEGGFKIIGWIGSLSMKREVKVRTVTSVHDHLKLTFKILL